MKDYFPLKLAQDGSFYNRKSELAFLRSNIEKCRHTVLVSPRRYGKSSLVYKVAATLKLPFASVDFFLAHDDQTIARRIMRGVAEAVTQIVPANEKVLISLQKIFRNFKITLSAGCFNVEISYDRGTLDPIEQIFNALQSLAKLAKEKNKLVLFFIDEFQDIANASSSKSIQGAIRHVAQETSDIIFMFSGGNRHLLLELFDDKSMPLYMLCDKLNLQRMSSKDYLPHIQKAAVEKWKHEIPRQTFEHIMSCAELHPFYVNMLCNELWSLDTLPCFDNVIDAWYRCFETEERRLVSELEKLTTNQQDLLKSIAINPVIEPTGQKFLATTGMAYSSIRQTIKSLTEKDILYRVQDEDEAVSNLKRGQIRVLDPLLAFALRKYQ